MDSWLSSLVTPTPTEGHGLAVRLGRLAVKKTQLDVGIRDNLRKDNEAEADALNVVPQVGADHFATIATSKDHWRVAK